MIHFWRTMQRLLVVIPTRIPPSLKGLSSFSNNVRWKSEPPTVTCASCDPISYNQKDEQRSEVMLHGRVVDSLRLNLDVSSLISVTQYINMQRSNRFLISYCVNPGDCTLRIQVTIAMLPIWTFNWNFYNISVWPRAVMYCPSHKGSWSSESRCPAITLFLWIANYRLIELDLRIRL